MDSAIAKLLSTGIRCLESKGGAKEAAIEAHKEAETELTDKKTEAATELDLLKRKREDLEDLESALAASQKEFDDAERKMSGDDITIKRVREYLVEQAPRAEGGLCRVYSVSSNLPCTLAHLEKLL